MDERTLAEGPGRVALLRTREEAVLSITDEATVRFAVEAAVLAAVVEGVPIQLSRPEGYCRIEANGDRVRLDYVLRDGGRGACVVPASTLASTLGTNEDFGPI